jgi:pyrroline-5-carboxylate reductase
MPNTPCLIGEGMTGVFFGKGSAGPLRKKILKILSHLGEVEEFSREQDLDLVTGLSGSGPAFVYLVAQGLIQGGEKLGLKPPVARLLAYQTLLGAAGMLKQSGFSPEELILQVATKGGTTEAGLKTLGRARVSTALAGAVREAAFKAKRIREENDRCTP